MRRRIIASSCAAALFSIAAVAAGQVNTQTPTQAPVQGNQQGTVSEPRSATRAPTNEQITIVGCVAREGAGNEFMLNNAMLANSAPANIAGGVAGSTSSAPPSAPGAGVTPGATGTSGTGRAAPAGSADATRGAIASPTMTYALTGDREKDLSQYVGQRVEVVATAEKNGAAQSAAPAGGAGAAPVSPASPGATATAPVVQKVEIVSFRAVGGACQ